MLAFAGSRMNSRATEAMPTATVAVRHQCDIQARTIPSRRQWRTGTAAALWNPDPGIAIVGAGCVGLAPTPKTDRHGTWVWLPRHFRNHEQGAVSPEPLGWDGSAASGQKQPRKPHRVRAPRAVGGTRPASCGVRLPMPTGDLVAAPGQPGLDSNELPGPGADERNVAEALVPVSEAWRTIAIVRVGFDAVGV